MSTIIGTFSSREQAEKAVRALRDKGFTEDEISVVAKRGGQQGDFETAGDDMGGMGGASQGTAWGSALGGVAGLLAGVGALAIPGIGPIVAAGPLAATLSGAVTGGVAGGLLDLGIPEERGRYFEEEVKKGRFLTVIDTDSGMVEDAAKIMRDNGAADVESH
ncbi:MAG: hypothetical protein GX998_05750 [Firmicutes bacterium]|nr:hypothetical protein [Bacillota bacterium]